MKTINIDGTEYTIDCNALTYVKYKSFFHNGIMEDMASIQEYLVRNSVYTDELIKTNKYTPEEVAGIVAEKQMKRVDDFIIKITQITWILIYTANNKVDDYETFMSKIKNFVINDDWIAEVTEFAVSCFCRSRAE